MSFWLALLIWLVLGGLITLLLWAMWVAIGRDDTARERRHARWLAELEQRQHLGRDA